MSPVKAQKPNKGRPAAPPPQNRRKSRPPLGVVRGLLAAVTIAAATIVLIAKFFEPFGVQAAPVNGCKRAVAEAGAWLMMLNDPFKSGEHHTRLGPVPSAASGGEWMDADAAVRQLESSVPGAGSFQVTHLDIADASQFNHPFAYEDYFTHQIELLRRDYGLPDVIFESQNAFEATLRLRTWTRSRWEHGTPKHVHFQFDALDLLQRAAKGERFFCSEYATTFVQALASVGLVGRYVALLDGHATAEVWSDDWQKWIVMDPTFDCYYMQRATAEQKEEPLSAWDIHRLLISGKTDTIDVKEGPYTYVGAAIPTNGGTSLYQHFAVRMRNDWYSNRYPHWHPKGNSIMNSLEWQDAFTRNDIRIAKETGRIGDLYWPLNRVAFQFQPLTATSQPTLRVKLVTLTPNFSFFRIVDDKNISVETDQDVFEWPLSPGENCLMVQAKNVGGWRGKPSSVCVTRKDGSP